MSMIPIRTENEGRTLVLDRIIHAPRPVIWQAWTKPALFKQWYCPKPWSVPEADFELRPGGRMNMVMAGPEGERVALSGSFLDVVPETRLVFTDSFTEGFMPRAEPFMTGFVELFDAEESTTRMVWGARHATAEAAQKHRDMGFEPGWNAAASQLEELARNLSE